MPDPILILGSMIAAALAAAVVLLFCDLIGQATPDSAQTGVATVLAVALGLVAGFWWLGARPHWPPGEDQDRLLLIVLPALVAVELVAAMLKPNRGIAWVLRSVVAAGVTPVLLYN